MDNWIKINSASDETRDAIDSVAEVLKDMGIDLVYDDEQATKDNVDLFIRLNHNRGLLGVGHDVLYKLGISTDLAPYYDSIKGDGAWDNLSPEQQRNIADIAESGLDLDESIDVAFSEAIQEETLKICPDCDRVLPEEWTRCFHCENKHGREVG